MLLLNFPSYFIFLRLQLHWLPLFFFDWDLLFKSSWGCYPLTLCNSLSSNSIVFSILFYISSWCIHPFFEWVTCGIHFPQFPRKSLSNPFCSWALLILRYFQNIQKCLMFWSQYCICFLDIVRSPQLENEEEIST